jgi:hypothetical protein
VGIARISLGRLVTALAAGGAVLLVLAPFLRLAEGAPAEGLDNSLYARTTTEVWGAFLFASALVLVALALWDSASRLRLAGPLLLLAAGTGSALGALALRSDAVLFHHCSWAGLSARYCDRSLKYYPLYEPSQALAAAALGGTLLVVAGLLLPLTTRYAPLESERRRRRLRSLSYM